MTDCLRNPVTLIADVVGIEENGISLLPTETKAKLTTMDDSENFVQLVRKEFLVEHSS